MKYNFFTALLNALVTGYTSVGCFYSGNLYQTFIESLDQTQCENAANMFSLTCCYDCGGTSHVSGGSMTVDTCLAVCTTNGFKYIAITG